MGDYDEPDETRRATDGQRYRLRRKGRWEVADEVGSQSRTVRTTTGSDGEPCSCGASHPVAVGTVVIDETAVDQLVDHVLRLGWQRPLVVMDANTAEVLGTAVLAALGRAGLGVSHLAFPERSGLLADERSVSQLEDRLVQSAADVLVAVGSGVITDVTRFVAHLRHLDFLSVPTAASMDGYASSVAAMEFAGMKATSGAVAPRAIFADPRIIAAAPKAMTRSGIGDLLGKASAHFDWRLSHGLFAEQHCGVVERRVSEPMVDVALHVEELLGGTPEAAARLLDGLVASGTAMAMVGTSRPASGCEHHASHFWDLLAQRGLRRHSAHGLQVGYATHFALRLQRFAVKPGAAMPFVPQPPAPESDEARSWFVGHEGAVDAVLSEKRAFLSANVGHWPKSASEWDTVVAATAAPRSIAPLVDQALSRAGIPAALGYLDLDATTLLATFRFANRIRARYTVIDFLEGQGLLEAAVEEVLGGIGTPLPPE